MLSIIDSKSSNSFELPTLFENKRVIGRIDNMENPIVDPLFTFFGWACAASGSVDPEIFINGIRQDHVQFVSRKDVEGALDGRNVIGWTITCDVSATIGLGKNVVHLELRNGGSVLARKNFRCRLPGHENNETVFFIHMPKTAGTSMRNSLERAKALKVLSVYQDPMFATPGQFSTFSKNVIKTFDLVYGHYRFGLHEGKSDHFKYMTMLRDPFEYVKSYYFFNRFERSLLNPVLDEDIFAALSSSKDINIDNAYTRYLAAVPDDRPTTEDDLQVALDNIDNHFAFIGIMENYPLSMRIISDYLGVDLAETQTNSGPQSHEKLSINEISFRGAAAHAVRFDNAIYLKVLSKFWGIGMQHPGGNSSFSRPSAGGASGTY